MDKLQVTVVCCISYSGNGVQSKNTHSISCQNVSSAQESACPLHRDMDPRGVCWGNVDLAVMQKSLRNSWNTLKFQHLQSDTKKKKNHQNQQMLFYQCKPNTQKKQNECTSVRSRLCSQQAPEHYWWQPLKSHTAMSSVWEHLQDTSQHTQQQCYKIWEVLWPRPAQLLMCSERKI